MTLITGRTVVRSNQGATLIGAKMYSRIVLPFSTSFGSDKREIISLAGGIIDFTNLEIGATYDFWRGRSSPIRHRIPTTAVTPYLLPAILGNDLVDECGDVAQYYPTASNFSVLLNENGNPILDEDGNQILVESVVVIAGAITGELLLRENDGDLSIGTTIYAKMIVPPDNNGITYDSAVLSVNSGVDGVISIPNLEPGATYLFWIGNSPAVRMWIPDDADDPYDLSPLIGRLVVNACDT